jgi:hypothetical protein
VSYDLHLLKEDEVGDDPARAYERLEADDDRELSPEHVEHLRTLAEALQEANPGVDLVEPDVGVFQLGYEAERPVVIDMESGEITMSWSFGASDAAPALEEVRRYLPIFEEYGYVAYDPQLEQLFDLHRDVDAAAAIHRGIHEQLDRAYGSARSSWWTRLFGSSRS